MKKLLCAALALTLLCGCGAASAPPTSSMPTTAAARAAAPGGGKMQCVYYEQDSFLAGIAAAPAYPLEGAPVAGMVPHHLLASDMIAGFFALAAGHSYDAVVLLSTSHYPEACASEVVTSAVGWNTPFGVAAADADVSEALLSNRLLAAAQDNAALEKDHGVSGLVPFVRYYLPKAQINAVLLANTLPAERVEALVEVLRALCEQKNILLVASVDCSHYLMPKEAAACDEETRRAIELRDYAAIRLFTDRNVDSPQCLTALLQFAATQKAGLVQLDHSSSPEKLPYDLTHPVYREGITTYFVYAATVQA